jgi:hypothetical protein
LLHKRETKREVNAITDIQNNDLTNTSFTYHSCDYDFILCSHVKKSMHKAKDETNVNNPKSIRIGENLKNTEAGENLLFLFTA